MLIVIFLDLLKVRTTIETENNMTAVERLLYFSTLPQEPDDVTTDAARNLDSKWLGKGDIRVEHLSLRYRKDQDLVLRGISLQIDGGQKIGICGRTGSGKSSYILVCSL